MQRFLTETKAEVWRSNNGTEFVSERADIHIYRIANCFY